jgi:hypothetical protein
MIDYEQLFEAKRQELARVEQREAFLRGQLEEAVQMRLKLIGAMEQLQALYQMQQAAEAAPEHINAEDVVRVGEPIGAITADRVARGRGRAKEAANGRDHA